MFVRFRSRQRSWLRADASFGMGAEAAQTVLFLCVGPDDPQALSLPTCLSSIDPASDDPASESVLAHVQPLCQIRKPPLVGAKLFLSDLPSVKPSIREHPLHEVFGVIALLFRRAESIVVQFLRDFGRSLSFSPPALDPTLQLIIIAHLFVMHNGTDELVGSRKTATPVNRGIRVFTVLAHVHDDAFHQQTNDFFAVCSSRGGSIPKRRQISRE